MKNILVTGGAGYIGSHIAEILIKKKYKVVIVDDLTTGYRQFIQKKAKFYKLNILKTSRLKKIIINNKIDSVIHLAASISVTNSKKNYKLFYKNNVIGTSSLIKACKNSLVKNLIFSSTAAIYKSSSKKVTEVSKIKTKSVYGITKLKAEKIITKNLKKLKINYAILRFFNVVGASPSKKIGPLKRNDTLFKNISTAMFNKNIIIKIYGNNFNTKDGTCIRDYIHVSDLSEIQIKILKKIEKTKNSIILNCGYGKGISVRQVVNEFTKTSNKDFRVIILKKRPADIESSIANNSRLKNFIKWKPKYNKLNFLVKSSIDWEKKLLNSKRI
jgi:UDP-glucose 4-epimerase